MQNGDTKRTVEDFFYYVRQEIGERQLAEILSKRRTASEKRDSSYVSEGDLMCDQIVRTGAEMFLGQHKLVSEEDKVSHKTDQYPARSAFVVDPRGGTANFVSGLSEWGTSI